MPVRALSGRPSRGATRPLPVVNKLREYSRPPPVGGWNARDSVANMDETDAVDLINWFPEETRVRVRRGSSSHVTGIGSLVESLMVWNGPTSSKLFGAAGPGIYDVTTAGTAGSPDASGFGSARWQSTMFSVSSGNYLFAVNGSDAPQRYNGTSWSATTMTGSGLTTSNLIHLNVFKNRMFFVEKNSLNAWYLPIDSITGTLTKLDLGPNCSRGGYLVAMGTWTRDGGDGVDDLAVFITSEGEVLLWQGNDPDHAADWALVGVFHIGVPIGRRCMTRVGNELIIITEDGFAPMSRFLQGGRASNKAAVSDKISLAVTTAVKENRTRFGWQPIFHPAGDMVLFNIPQSTENVQYVSHATTGAWCKFTGWDAQCFAVVGNELYYGGNGTVYKADTGLSDDGANIETIAKTAFSYFGSRGIVKRYAMVRPVLQVDGAVSASIGVNVDFEDDTTNSTISFVAQDGAEWDVSEWNAAQWGRGAQINRDWHAIGAVGISASLRFETQSMNGAVYWLATDWKFEAAANAGYL